MGQMINGSKIIVGQLERKNPLKYTVKQEDNIKKELGYEALFVTHFAQGRVAWKVTVNKVTEIWD